MTFTDDELKIIQEQVGAVQSSADVHWVVYCGVLVFLMQAGFAMLCAGSLREKNIKNVSVQ